jgi:ATP-binding protein involved in chromosome partitioning
MQGEPPGHLPDRNGTRCEPHVTVQPIPGVVRQGLVDLESLGISHGGPWCQPRRIIEVSTVSISIILEIGMPTKEEVRQALRGVLDPEIGKPIEDVGMLKDIVVEDGAVRVYILLTIAGCPLKDRINNDVTAAVGPILDPGQRVEVILGEMNSDERQALVNRLRGASDGQPQERHVFFTESDTTVIAVASGKGGVGKSSVTVNLAAALASEGHRVGIVDVDVWGFSIPRMMGVSGKPVAFNNMMMPLESHGVRIISMGFFVPEETPVIWRGPMLHKAVQQFLGDVYWGELDFLLADLPPGTGDVSISIAGFLPGAQMLVVTTPQEAARKVAERAGKMAVQTRLRVAGVIENMSYFVCPHCGEKTSVFGEGGGEEAARTLGVPLIGQIPIMVELREGGDAGIPIVVSHPDSPAGIALREAARRLASETKTLVRRPLGLTVSPRA